jgi:hypothetical protein
VDFKLLPEKKWGGEIVVLLGVIDRTSLKARQVSI